MIEKLCKNCNKSFPQYNTAVTLCQVCAFNKYNKPNKPITKIGKRTKEYDKWRREVAIPYLDEKFGRLCVYCGATERLDINHIKTRGSRPDLKMEITNIEYACRLCHTKLTDGKEVHKM